MALGGVGEVIGSQSVAAVFAVCAGLVMSLVRYDDLLEALKTAGLDQSDEIRLEHRYLPKTPLLRGSVNKGENTQFE